MAKYGKWDPRNKKKDRNKKLSVNKSESKINDVYTQKNSTRLRGSGGHDLGKWSRLQNA